jgi:uncharacterized protein YbcI
MEREGAADDLLRAADTSPPPAGALRSELANAMVGMKKKYYGRGPESAKAWILDDYVFVAMEGGLTRNEETLLADGKEDVVRSFRLSFQETMTETATSAVEELTGRKVRSYHSQVVFNPMHAFEVFVLEPAARD